MTSKYMIRLFLATAALAVVAAACSGNEKAGMAGDSGAKPPEPVELVFYSCGNTSEASFNMLYGDAIRQKYPHFKLTYISGLSASKANELIPKMLASNTVDINFDSIGNIPACLLKFELQKDMGDLVAKTKMDLNRFEPTAIQGIRELAQGGGLYGIPVFNNTRVLYYNKDLFDKFGVPYPTDNMSWDEAIALGKRMTRTDGGVSYLGLAASEVHQIRLNALSIPIVNPSTGKPTINTDERWRTVLTKGFYEPNDDQTARQVIAKAFTGTGQFTKDKIVAMMPGLANQAADQADQFAEVNWDMVTEPYYKERPGYSSQVYPTYFSVTSQSKHRDEAMQAISVLASEEHQLFLSRMGQIPVLENETIKKALGQESKFKDKNWKAVFLHKPAPIPYKSKHDIDLEVIYRKQILAYSQGKVDLNTLLRSAEEEAVKYLEANK
ncbi:extracellular solute-binding protein [Paenibacillus hemerocallicola]|uniref:Extracellular solute-binding protein n=1 Tax=Paenibacillus hemerocallicola TaxID=1172614 RepID=A0A5C4T3R9_9BACL|nr:extracellular solute-binding protein [Paenibacillus hemerocallicola]TNJ63683.1 extracellular solute-binding protein [Paenibacillus hemerocallicola]